MLSDGLECCGLSWCFYQTLVLTAPIHCRASIADGMTFLQIWWRNKLTLILIFHQNVNFWVDYSFKRVKNQWNQWSPYNLTLLQVEQTTGSSDQRGTAPPTEPGFSQGFFSVLSPMEFGFLAIVASGLFSWRHFISRYRRLHYIDTIITELSWTMTSLNSIMNCLQLKI